MISASLAPKLDTLFQLKREEANIKAGIMGVTPYEAMLDQYDPGRRGAAGRQYFR